MKKFARRITGITVAALVLIGVGTAFSQTALANQSSGGYITVDEAKAIAMTHAGVTEGGYYGYEFSFDIEHGVAVYEIDFKTAETEYEYDINASTGEIVKNKQEYNDDTRKPPQFQNATTADTTVQAPAVTTPDATVQTPTATTPPAVTEYITVDEAKTTALTHAGVAEGDYYDYEFGFDTEHGVAVYEIDFKTLENEYEYDINAVTGEIVKEKKEYNDDRQEAEAILGQKNTDATTDVATTYITSEDAKAIALSDAGVHENNIYDYELDFEVEHGVAVYEIEFESMNYEHEYDINAVTGEIIKSDKEPRD